MEKICNEFLDQLKTKNASVALLCAPEHEDGFFRVFTTEDEMEWSRINDLIDGCEKVKDELVKRRREIDKKAGNKPIEVERIMEIAEKFKEDLWFYIDASGGTDANALKSSMNEILDTLDMQIN